MTILPLVLAASVGAAGEEALARVDGVTVTAAALARRVEQVRAQGKRPTAEQVLDSLVDEVLLAAEARKLGLAGSREVAAKIEAETRRLAAEAFLEKHVGSRVQVQEADLRDMFHRTSDFAYFESATFESAEAANAALSRLRSGSTFAAAVTGAIVSQLHPNAAAAPPMMRAQLEPALAAALFAAAPGAVVGPVKLQTGFALARLIGKEIGSEELFRERREALHAHAKKQAASSTRAQFAKHLREAAHVELDQKFLERLGAAPPTAAELDHVIARVNGRPLRYGEIYETVRMLGGASGHMAGASIKIGLAWKEVEGRLLEDLAVERGFDKAAEVAARLPELERAALALAAVEHIRRTAPQDRKDSALGERVAALRKKASISLDAAALARAGIQGP